MSDLNKNVCKIVGHEWKKDPDTLTSACTRCTEKRAWNDAFLKKLGTAMAAPLKVNLDYQGLSKKLIRTEEIKQSDLPIYDEDLQIKPDQEI